MQTPSILQANKLNIDVAIMQVHFQLPILLLRPPQKKSYKMKQRCNTTRYFVGISLSCFKGRTCLSCSWSIHTRLFSKIQKNYRCFAQLLNKNSLYQPKIWEQMFSPFTLRLNLSFVSRSQEQQPNDLLFPILNWKFKSYTTVCKYCQYAFNME